MEEENLKISNESHSEISILQHSIQEFKVKGGFIHPQVEIRKGIHGFGIFWKENSSAQRESETEITLIKIPTQFILNRSSILASDSTFEHDIQLISKEFPVLQI